MTFDGGVPVWSGGGAGLTLDVVVPVYLRGQEDVRGLFADWEDYKGREGSVAARGRGGYRALHVLAAARFMMHVLAAVSYCMCMYDVHVCSNTSSTTTSS